MLLEEQGPLPPDLARQGTEIALALPNLPKVRQRALQPINLESNDYRVQTWLVRIYHVLGDDASAEELARKSLAQHPGTPDTWITLVGQLARTGKRTEALKITEQSRAKVPTPVIASTVARCYEAAGDLERAEAAFVQGWKEQPADFILAMQATDFFQRTDQLTKALPMLAGVLQPSAFVPREFVPRLRRQLALALVEKDASLQSKALAILDLNGKAGAESPVNQRARAFVLAADARGRPDALKRFKESLKSAPAQDEELYLLALIHEKAGEIFEATDILEQLATFQPENPQYLARLTRLLAGQSRATEARTTLERLQRLEPASLRTRQAQEAVERAGA